MPASTVLSTNPGPGPVLNSGNGDVKRGQAGIELPIREKERLILGNGASELIDLVVRSSRRGVWRPGPSVVQYKEYERSALSHGHTIFPKNNISDNINVDNGKISDNDGEMGECTICSIVNPCNPTGDYMPLPKLKQWIEQTIPPNTVVTVDESMQPWLGPHWRTDSLVSQEQWISDILERKGVCVYVVHSWTKIWSCTGLRIGSVICPSVQLCRALRGHQVPWSVNTAALVFLSAVVEDGEYLEKTWDLTAMWHRYSLMQIQRISKEKQLGWETHGGEYLSWIWIDMKSPECAERAVSLAKAQGVPVRWGKYGYEMPSFVRIAVREPALFQHLVDAWASL